jgi:hypothetical protein
MLDWVKDGEAALCSTAAVFRRRRPVREGGRECKVSSGVGPNTKGSQGAGLDAARRDSDADGLDHAGLTAPPALRRRR